MALDDLDPSDSHHQIGDSACRFDKLIADARKGIKDACERLAVVLSPRLREYRHSRNRFVPRRGPRDSSAAIQETLLQVQRKLDGFEGHSIEAVEAWAFAIYRNSLSALERQDHARRLREERYAIDLHALIKSQEEGGADRSALSEEEVAKIKRAYSKLNTHEQFLLRLRIIEGSKPRQIASEIGSSASATSKACQRALKKFIEFYHSS